MRVSVHAGAHRTATAPFQKMLRNHARRLNQAGTMVFLPRQLRRGPIRMHKLAQGALTKSPEALKAVRAAFARSTGGADHVILSDENLLGSAHGVDMRTTGLLYPKGHLRVQRFLSGLGIRQATIYLSVRDPARFIAGIYGQSVTSRGYIPFRHFLGGLDVCTLFWSEFVERIVACPNVERVVVWRYEDNPGGAMSVLHHMLPADLADGIRPEGDIEETDLSSAALARIEAEVTEGALLTTAAMRAIQVALPESDDTPRFMPFDDALLHESARYYAEDLADVARIPGVTVLE